MGDKRRSGSGECPFCVGDGGIAWQIAEGIDVSGAAVLDRGMMGHVERMEARLGSCPKRGGNLG